MYVCWLESNPSTALCGARTDLLVVMNRGKPNAVLIGFKQIRNWANFVCVRQAIAVSLFRDCQIFAVDIAELANEPTPTMLTRMARLWGYQSLTTLLLHRYV